LRFGIAYIEYVKTYMYIAIIQSTSNLWRKGRGHGGDDRYGRGDEGELLEDRRDGERHRQAGDGV
jgi:hypothetical protein